MEKIGIPGNDAEEEKMSDEEIEGYVADDEEHVEADRGSVGTSEGGAVRRPDHGGGKLAPAGRRSARSSHQVWGWRPDGPVLLSDGRCDATDPSPAATASPDAEWEQLMAADWQPWDFAIDYLGLDADDPQTPAIFERLGLVTRTVAGHGIAVDHDSLMDAVRTGAVERARRELKVAPEEVEPK
jgi:hypothetical protein